ncbi:glycosyltransferase family 4 protein [Orrella sp. NBD-18]|uniref:Glycosyltransferase family 4 protein n=1 Tax=Sheuella amnicola TaxID=2707330 RepID=A0A6B2QZR2_9BURK|nr:glycosyltransferase family 1 protein [Sheuella amnicola]NDY83512.1 glycosyltransferase family 4 protein [Sheuella amnicola]
MGVTGLVAIVLNLASDMNKAAPPTTRGRIKNYLFENAIKPAGHSLYRFLFNSPLKKVVKNLALKSAFVEGALRSVSLSFIHFQMRKVDELKIRKPGSDKLLFIDASLLIKEDLKTGIQRVSRSILLQLLSNPPEGYDIKVVYANKDIGYKIAQVQCENFESLSLRSQESDELIAIHPGDIFLGLDFACYPTILEKNYLNKIHSIGVKVYFVVYDLLPVQFPSYFPPVSNRFHAKWLRTISQFDGVICISATIANEYQAWLNKKRISVNKDFKIKHFHLGSDLSNSSPTKGLPPDAPEVLKQLKSKTTFLLVGTIEPRKGYGQMLQAFTQLWAEGADVNLVIVGKVGWNIQNLVDKISTHPELGRRLYWLQGISDEYLEGIYSASSCLIAASEAEGFGLPIIEAAHHHIPVIARDIPVFREVAGDAAFYFSDRAKSSIADQFKIWIDLNKENKHPKSDGVRYITWQQSAEQLKKAVFD